MTNPPRKISSGGFLFPFSRKNGKRILISAQIEGAVAVPSLAAAENSPSASHSRFSACRSSSGDESKYVFSSAACMFGWSGRSANRFVNAPRRYDSNPIMKYLLSGVPPFV